MVNTFDMMPPRARQILYSDGTPGVIFYRKQSADIVPVNGVEAEVNLPASTNPYGQWVIINAPNATVRNFGSNPKRNVLINNATGNANVEYAPLRAEGTPLKGLV
ncbi:hypothetical protein Esti_003271 [Eimeria stiedai]